MYASFGTTAGFDLKTIIISDNKINLGSRHRKRISLSEDYDVSDWSNGFDISQDQQKKMVRKVVDNRQAIEDYLKLEK